MIGVNSLSMHYNGRLLYDEVNLHLLRGNRYGLVGANGCGKSTFLRLLSGAETPSLGDILLPKAACIGWLKQDQFRYEQNTLVDVVIQGKQKLWDALQEKETILSQETFDEKSAIKLAHW
jgi:ATPase subunit of ABC transporter with duplicated ATPase domains